MSDDNTVCLRSNISAAGRRRRSRLAVIVAVSGVVAVLLLRVFLPATSLGAASFALRAAVAFPFAAVALAVYLEVSRKTCVLLADKGRRELDTPNASGRMTEAVAESEAAASRRVARSIYRDAIVGGAVAASAAAWLLHVL